MRRIQYETSGSPKAVIYMSYDTRNSKDKLKVYASDDAREGRCCGSCGNRLIDIEHFSKCAIDGHYIGYLDCDFCWCRRWKRNRRFDGETFD